MSALDQRRDFLRGIAALPLLAGAAAATTDPIFASISDIRAWRAASNDVPEGDAFDRMMDVEIDKMEALSLMQPATVLGAATYLQLFLDFEGDLIESSPLLDALVSTIAALRGLV